MVQVHSQGLFSLKIKCLELGQVMTHVITSQFSVGCNYSSMLAWPAPSWHQGISSYYVKAGMYGDMKCST